MSKESEENPKQVESTESKPNLLDTMYSHLRLPEMQGSLLANSHLLREIILALVQSNVLSKEQVEDILAKVEKRITELYDDLSQDTKDKGELASEVITRMKDNENLVLQKIRERLTNSQSEGESNSAT